MVKTRNNQKKEVQHSLKLIIKASFFVFFSILLSKVLTYVYRIIIAREFGPETYGIFTLAVLITTWISTLTLMGLSDGVLRFIPLFRGRREYAKIKHIFKVSIISLSITSFIGFAILFFFAETIAIQLFNNPELTTYLRFFSFLIPIFLFSSLFLSIIRSFEKINLYSLIFNVLQNITKVGLLIFFIFLGLKSNALILSFMLGISIMLIASYLVCKHSIPQLFGKYTLKNKEEITKNLFSYSFPLMFYGIISTLLFWIDSLFLGIFTNESLTSFSNVSAVGFYNVAVPIAMLLSFSPEILIQLFFPLITKAYSRKKSDLISEISKQVSKWIFIFNLPLFVIMFFFPGVLINLFFGEQYLIAQNALRFLAIGFLMNSITIVASNLLSMAGKSRIILFNTLFISIINIILNFTAISLFPSRPLEAVAIATSTSLTLLTVLTLFQSKKYVSIVPLRKKMLNVFFAALIPFLILFFVKGYLKTNLLTLILSGLFFSATYLILIFLFKCLDENDLEIINSIKRKIYKI